MPGIGFETSTKEQCLTNCYPFNYYSLYGPVSIEYYTFANPQYNPLKYSFTWTGVQSTTSGQSTNGNNNGGENNNGKKSSDASSSSMENGFVVILSLLLLLFF